MHKIKVYNKISKEGLALFNSDSFTIEDSNSPDIILCRSQNLHNIELNENLKCIGRAGAGVNNIPVSNCTDNGIVVFNTPGANANAVKELVLAGLLLGARNIFRGMNYVNSLKTKDINVSEDVEKNKSLFKGVELSNKKLGVIGLGAIGTLVANAASNLGLDVYGYDPYISVGHAWGLSRSVKQADSLKRLLSEVDFLTLHMPLNDSTRLFLDSDKISYLKKDCILLNFSRPEIIDEDAIISALKSKKVSKYVSDFPTNALLENDNFIGLPHLGASTIEAEDNCALMLVNQVNDFINNGNITNSVNFPSCTLESVGGHRIVIMNDNIPNMVGQISSIIADHSLNILEMVNKSKNDIAYSILELDSEPDINLLKSLSNISGVKFVRKIN